MLYRAKTAKTSEDVLRQEVVHLPRKHHQKTRTRLTAWDVNQRQEHTSPTIIADLWNALLALVCVRRTFSHPTQCHASARGSLRVVSEASQAGQTAPFYHDISILGRPEDGHVLARDGRMLHLSSLLTCARGLCCLDVGESLSSCNASSAAASSDSKSAASIFVDDEGVDGRRGVVQPGASSLPQMSTRIKSDRWLSASHDGNLGQVFSTSTLGL